MQIDGQHFNTVHQHAVKVAHVKAMDKYNEIGGDRMACGFAWVTVYGVRSNSKLGKMMAELGYRKDYRNAFVLWNPSAVNVQNVDIKEAGANAYSAEVKKMFPELRIFAESRLD
jgi:hypothetical protein